MKSILYDKDGLTISICRGEIIFGADMGPRPSPIADIGFKRWMIARFADIWLRHRWLRVITA